MSLWAFDAPASKLCLCFPSKSTERCQLSRILTYCTQVVSLLALSSKLGAEVIYRSAGPLSTRSKLGRDDIKWQELLLHFRSVQSKHEKSRRQALGADTTPFSGFSAPQEKIADPSLGPGRPPSSAPTRPAIRRKVTGGDAPTLASVAVPPRNALSPLNPRSRGSIAPSSLNPQSPTTAQAQTSRQVRVVSNQTTRKPG